MVNRVADKESAKSILKHNGNQAAMIGMEILYTIISALTVTTMMAAFSAAAVSIYGTTLVSLVVSFISLSGIFGKPTKRTARVRPRPPLPMN